MSKVIYPALAPRRLPVTRGGGGHWGLPGKPLIASPGRRPLPSNLPSPTTNSWWRSFYNTDINTKRRQRLAYTLGEEEWRPNSGLVRRYLLNTRILTFLCPKERKTLRSCPLQIPRIALSFSVSGMRVLRGIKVWSGYGNPLQYSCWRVPWTEEPGGLQSFGWQRGGHDWRDLACTCMRVFRARKEGEGNIKTEKKRKGKQKTKRTSDEWGIKWAHSNTVSCFPLSRLQLYESRHFRWMRNF